MIDHGEVCAFLIDNKSREFDSAFSEDVKHKLSAHNGGRELLLITKDDLGANASFPSVKYIFSTWNMPRLSSEDIKRLFPALECVFYAAGSVKYFAKPFFDCGVRVFCANAENAIPVAEYAAAQIILAAKGFFNSRISPLNHFFKAKRSAAVYPGNYHAKVGILGAGHVGKLVIEILKRETDFDVLAYDPYVSDEECRTLGCKKASLEEVFRECDVISNHMPDIDETKGIINKSLLSLLKPTAGVVNTGRGAQLVEKDLAVALKAFKGRFAVLDVTFPEPIRPWNPLLRMKNVYVSPHIAGSVGSEIGRLGEAMYEAFEAVLREDSTRAEVFERQLFNIA